MPEYLSACSVRMPSEGNLELGLSKDDLDMR